MRPQPFRLLLAIFSITVCCLQAQQPESKNEAHGKMLERLYPTPAFKVVSTMEAPRAEYQAAVNQAYNAGVPSSLLNELVAVRAMKNADAASLRQLLPTLKSNVEMYRPEASIFPDKRSASFLIKTIEMALSREEQSPGALAKTANFANEKAIARDIHAQLGLVDSMVDQEAIEKNLPAGTPVAEARWRSHAKVGSRLATAGTDELGNPFGAQVVDTKPTVPKASYERLKAVVPNEFWAPYGLPK